MILVDGEKYACQQCIRGHRSSTCKHIKRPLVLVRSRGRPLTDSYQRIAIFAEEIQDVNEKEKILKNEKNPSDKNLLAAKRIKDHETSSPSSCCNKTNDTATKIKVEPDHASSKIKVEPNIDSHITPKPEPKEDLDIKTKQSSCCSKKTDSSIKQHSNNQKTTCHCCTGSSDTYCKKETGPIYILKAAKRQVYNVEKDSLRLLDPVVEIPNSKVGLDIIQKVSKKKKMTSCRNKRINEKLLNNVGYIGKHVPSASCCSVKQQKKSKQPELSKTKAPALDKNNTPFVYQFQVSMNKKASSRSPSTSNTVKTSENDYTTSLDEMKKVTNSRNIPIEASSKSNLFDFQNNYNNSNDGIQVTNSNNKLTDIQLPNISGNVNQNGIPQSLLPDISNNMLYDLYIADSCTVPGSCSCEPDKCECPDCTEHSKYRNSNLTVKQQFEEFPFPINDMPIHTDYPLNKDSHGIRPFGKVEMQSSIPLFEQSFLKVLSNHSVNEASNQIQLYSDNNSSDMQECYCEPDECCCYNCIQHGIIDGIRASDGVCVAEKQSTPQEIQLLGSQFPLYAVSPSSSSRSTPTVMSESDEFFKNTTASRSNIYNNSNLNKVNTAIEHQLNNMDNIPDVSSINNISNISTMQSMSNMNINNIYKNNSHANEDNISTHDTNDSFDNNSSTGGVDEPINYFHDKDEWMRHHNKGLYTAHPTLNMDVSHLNKTNEHSENIGRVGSNNGSVSSNPACKPESISSSDELLSRLLHSSNGNDLLHDSHRDLNEILLNIGHNLQPQNIPKCHSSYCEKLNCDGNHSAST